MAPAIAAQRGWRVTIVPVDATGRIQIERLEGLWSDRARLGVRQQQWERCGDYRDRAAGARRGIVSYRRAAVAAGPLRVDDLGVDLLTLAGHDSARRVSAL
jgi:selenocysteine lyase/cysteine desulfurase